MPFFFLPFIWLGVSLTLLIISISQFIKLIKERKSITRLRLTKTLVFTGLFLLTFFRSIPDLIIEKADWFLLYNKRTDIVRQVIDKELNPNVSWNGWVCELPFEFPVVSNGGNDIGIFRSKENGQTTVQFWVFRNFFDSPSIYFVYTDNPVVVKRIEQKITQNPKENWKIANNWYRIFGDW